MKEIWYKGDKELVAETMTHVVGLIYGIIEGNFIDEADIKIQVGERWFQLTLTEIKDDNQENI